jgi:hypothetical protein
LCEKDFSLLYTLVENFNKRSVAMATVNFSVPDDVKAAFNAAFRGENKSAIIAQLMRQAVDERQRQEQRAGAIDALLGLRCRAKPMNDTTLRKVREQDRP